MESVLVLGASGVVGSNVVRFLDENHDGIEVVLATSKVDTAKKWEAEGKKAVVLDLNNPDTYGESLKGIDRMMLLTTYTVDMLFQAKSIIDAAKDAGVSHIVHLGVYTSRRDPIPHFTWHDMIENYLASTGIAWTNVHPNVITDTITRTFEVHGDSIIMPLWGNVPQGYACARDIGEVIATVLREGPEKHAGKDYYLSIDVLNADDMAAIFEEETGKKVTVTYVSGDDMAKAFEQISDPGIRTYMKSALICSELTRKNKFAAQTAKQDDVLTVTGHPGTSMREYVRKVFVSNPN